MTMTTPEHQAGTEKERLEVQELQIEVLLKEFPSVSRHVVEGIFSNYRALNPDEQDPEVTTRLARASLRARVDAQQAVYSGQPS